MYQVKDLMTAEVITLRESDDLGMVDAIFRLGRIRHLPVVDTHGHLRGLVTHRDLLRAVGREGKERNTPAGQVMNTELTTVAPYTPLRRALDLMVQNKYGCLPVVGDDDRLVGIVTEADLVRFAADTISDLDIWNRRVSEDSDV